MGCSVEVLRKDFHQHLEKEGFGHSIMFIEGQTKKNCEINELKQEIVSLRKDYDSEIQSMYWDMNHVKE